MIAFRRVRAPITPIVKRIPLRIRKRTGGTPGIVITLLLTVFPYFFLLLKTTAPTMAATRRTETISKGKRYRVNRTSPIVLTF